MSLADTRKGEVFGGHKCLGHSKDGLWAIFKLDNTYEWSEQRRLEWESEKFNRQQKVIESSQQRRERTLSADERHELYSKILVELALDEITVADLRRRGFSEAEIDASGFKSVVKGQELKAPIDERLPGISKDGKRLIVGGDGYLCPLLDFDNRIVGLQLRLHNPLDGNRYRWLSDSSSQTLALLIKGEYLENPLAMFRPEGKPEGIALAEGTGVKPFLVSRRLNLLTIGAAGGQWATSPHLLKEYLERAYLEIGGFEKIVTLYPDAGDTDNKQVVNRWKKVCELLTDLGWSFRFGWWGQTDKEIHNDIDELIDYNHVEYITGKEFFTIAEVGVKNADKRKEQSEKSLKKQQELESLTTARNQLTSIVDLPYKVVNVPHMKEVLLDLIEPGTINIVISDTGTGKSESMIPLAQASEAFYSWHNRISLGRMMSATLDIKYKDDVSKYNKTKAAFCAPSAYQFNPKVLANHGILLIDECDQVFDFLFGSLCNKDGIRPLLLSTLEGHFESAVAGKGVVLCMSADITQKEIDYIKALAPEGTPVRIIINKYQPERTKIHHDSSSSPDALVGKLIESLREEIPCFVLDDMKNGVRGCKSVAEYIRTTMPEMADLILEIHADNTNDPRVKVFFDNPDEESKKYLLIICSPSVISGVSLKNQRFINGVFGFCNGILIDREIKQFLNRVRGAKEVYLWIAEEGFSVKGIDNNLVTPEEIKDYYRRNYEANCKHLLSYKPEYEAIKAEWRSPHFDLFCKNLAYRIITMKHLRHFTLKHLQEIGYEIIDINYTPSGGTKQIGDGLRAIWTGIEIAEAEAVAAARFLSEAEMEAIEFSQEAIPPELLPAYRKTRMRQQFGEELVSATNYHHKKSGLDFTGYAAMALKNARGDYGQQLEAFYLLNQDLNESISRDYAAENRQHKRGHGRFAGDIRWNGRKRKCREFLGLPEFLDPEKWWEPNDYKQLAEKAKQHAPHIKDALGLSVENITAGQIFGELMHQIGLSFETKAVEGEKWKLRKINIDDWNYAQMYIQYKESLKTKQEPVAETAAAFVEGFTPEILAEYLPEVDSKEMYEQLVFGVDQSVIEGAWVLVAPEVRDRIIGFYAESQPLQLTIEDIKNTTELGEVITCELGQVEILEQRENQLEQEEILAQQWWLRVKKYAHLVVKKLSAGVQAVKGVLSGLSFDEKWGVMMSLEELDSKQFERFTHLLPEWVEFCNA